jgi:hypothetical protein
VNAGEGRPERRQSPRVDLLAELQGRIVTLEEVRVTQLSLGGMTIETGVPLSPRSSHEFRLSYGNRTAVLKGHVAHSRVKVDGDHLWIPRTPLSSWRGADHRGGSSVAENAKRRHALQAPHPAGSSIGQPTMPNRVSFIQLTHGSWLATRRFDRARAVRPDPYVGPES